MTVGGMTSERFYIGATIRHRPPVRCPETVSNGLDETRIKAHVDCHKERQRNVIARRIFEPDCRAPVCRTARFHDKTVLVTCCGRICLHVRGRRRHVARQLYGLRSRLYRSGGKNFAAL
jgi:hypothetical protein